MNKKALITGVTGQDGSYLAEYLLELGYEVHGIIRRKSVCEDQKTRIDHLKNLNLRYGDVLDQSCLNATIKEIQPNEIYNLAAQSHVQISFKIPYYTIETNSLGVLNILEAIRQNCPNARMYQASSSEMFGNSIDADNFQRETTPMHPVSPYGCSKLMAYSLVRNYRKSYNLFVCNGILFNHESPRRSSNFVTNKVVKGAIRIKFGLQDKLCLGNLEASRDWGNAKDYVKAMHLILNHKKADDFVVATGVTNTVRHLCDYVFNKLGMNYIDFVEQKEEFLRPEELNILKGDYKKVNEQIGWEPTHSFESTLDEMIDSEMKNY